MAIVCSIGICFCCVSTIHADEEGKNLDLNTEDVNRENNESLSDSSGIPVFSDNFIEGGKEILNREDIFIKDMSKIEGDIINRKELFQESVVVSTKVEETSSSGINIIWFVIGVIIIGVVTVVATKTYQKKKYQGRVNNDSNIY